MQGRRSSATCSWPDGILAVAGLARLPSLRSAAWIPSAIATSLAAYALAFHWLCHAHAATFQVETMPAPLTSVTSVSSPRALACANAGGARGALGCLDSSGAACQRERQL